MWPLHELAHGIYKKMYPNLEFLTPRLCFKKSLLNYCIRMNSKERCLTYCSSHFMCNLVLSEAFFLYKDFLFLTIVIT